MTTNRLVTALLLLLAASQAWAQNGSAASAASDPGETALRQQIVELRALVEKLQARVDDLEKRSEPPAQAGNAAPPQQPKAQTAAAQPPQAETAAAQPPASASTASGFLHDTTINLLMDGYYSYNSNDPIGRVNLLRAFDVSSNAFSLNQAALVLENAPDPDNGKRFGLRLDFQYGQATETLQGNPSNEPRPDIYRNIFQAYGTYVFPIGKGLTIDFGKFASSLGMEGNYTKDQINYSRSYWFDFLPFYHMGVRANYKFSKEIAFNYWIVNGTQQTEPFNGFKDQFLGFTITPNDKVTWNVNYYLGQEHPDVIFFPNGGAPPNLPTEQGVPFEPILNPPAGKLHIFDTYVNWQATPKLMLALEADDEIERLFTYSSPSHTDGGAAYFRYQLTPKVAVAARAEYLSDRGGLFTGVTQAIKETTFTTEYKFVEGFLARGEWRTDFSNQPYFLTDILGPLKKDQNTATLGLVWWMGGKQGAW
jgi:Putative beta-barrel porin-2, OmpL-like. bbp2